MTMIMVMMMMISLWRFVLKGSCLLIMSLTYIF